MQFFSILHSPRERQKEEEGEYDDVPVSLLLATRFVQVFVQVSSLWLSKRATEAAKVIAVAVAIAIICYGFLCYGLLLQLLLIASS